MANNDAQLDGDVKDARKRGPTKCLKIWTRHGTNKIPISTNDFGQPVGSTVSMLSSFLGAIARKDFLAPFIYRDWRKMPKKYKEDMWEIVKSKFAVNESDKDWIMESINKKWRSHKSRIKSNCYDIYEDEEERLASIPESISKVSQWHALVGYWSSSNGKVLCAENKENRGKQKMGHTAGTKSFACVEYEEQEKRSNGEPFTKIDLFLKTHTRKDGTPVDQASSQAIEEIKQPVSEQPENLHDNDVVHKIMSQVLGEERYGRA